jgi:nitrile hydratase subunit beta
VDGIHDLGGMEGFGPVPTEADEPVFHAPWEGRVLGMLFAATGQGVATTDAYRHAVERMDPAHYLAAPYYERMLTGLATLLVERGVVTREELEQRAGGRVPLCRPVASAGRSPEPDVSASPFAVGDQVVVRDIHPRGHTRCPRYVRGRAGVVVRVDGSFRVPDVAAHAPDAPREPTYAVRFAARDLWGDEAPEGEFVHVDLWHRYLAPG